MKNILKRILKYKLKNLAKFYLWRINPEVVVITGTTDRITFKDAIFDEIKDKKNVRISPDNHNAEIGIPLSVLGLKVKRRADWLYLSFKACRQALFGKKVNKIILELAIDRPNDMDYLLRIITPSVVVITGIEPVYMENFGTLDNIALEYEKLVKAVDSSGLVVLNNDNQRVIGLARAAKAKVVTFAIDAKADYQATGIKKNEDGQSFYLGDKNIFLNKFGKHHILAKLAAIIIDSALSC